MLSLLDSIDISSLSCENGVMPHSVHMKYAVIKKFLVRITFLALISKTMRPRAKPIRKTHPIRWRCGMFPCGRSNNISRTEVTHKRMGFIARGCPDQCYETLRLTDNRQAWAIEKPPISAYNFYRDAAISLGESRTKKLQRADLWSSLKGISTQNETVCSCALIRQRWC